jgi:hypothetical protein
MPYSLFNRSGFSIAYNVTIGTSEAVFACTADTTNAPNSFAFPHNGNIQSVEIYMTALDAGSLTVQMYMARDSGGLVPITPKGTSGSTQNISYTDGTTKGGVVFNIGSDFNFDSAVPNTTNGTVYVIAKVSSGESPAFIRVNWRA